MVETNAKISQYFLSLKWKATILFGLILLILNLSIPSIVYWHLQQQFESSRVQSQQQYTREISAQIQQSGQEIRRISKLFDQQSLIHNPVDDRQIISLLKSYQNTLSSDWNIVDGYYLNRNGIILAGWGSPLPENLSPFFNKLKELKEPLTLLSCEEICKQFEFIPIIQQRQLHSVLVFSRGLNHSLQAFKKHAGVDIGVIKLSSAPQSNDRINFLNAWQAAIIELTSAESQLKNLSSLSKTSSFNINNSGAQIFNHSELPIEIMVYPLTNSTDTFWVILTDISQQQAEIMKLVYRSFMITFISSILLVIGLFYFLSGPLKRLYHVSEALPFLASKNYQSAHELIPTKTSSPLPIDELGLLETSTHELTSRLESLEVMVQHHNHATDRRNKELQQERDFNKELIDTAQLIIITLNENLDIITLNDYGEKTTGFKETELRGKPIAQLFTADSWPETKYMFEELLLQHSQAAQQETEFFHSDGTVKTISWHHSRLKESTGNQAIILTVGLDLTHRREAEKQIEWMAAHDPLTNLFNRRKFTSEFERVLQTSVRYGHTGTLFFLDLDHFKDVNDSSGHKTGDQLLKKVAAKLQEITRFTDIVARIGGDEFAIILPESDSQGAINLANKICDEFNAIDFMINNVPHKVSTSIGMVHFPMIGCSIQELMSNADIAMYQAKRTGRGTWHVFSSDDKTRDYIDARLFWKQKIETALEQDLFVLHYQPILSLQNDSISHYEVLLRMQNEDDSLSFPGSFIMIAEQIGLIHAIDHYVLKQAIFKQAELEHQGSPIKLSINLSGHVIDDPLLLPLLKKYLEESKANPHNLMFELTETAAVADLNQARKFMQRVIHLGCQFSLDDFGSGFASFNYMKSLPISIVKIDGSFITNLTKNPDDQRFVKALVDIAQGMEKQTLAEFVEDKETLDLLRSYGVDYAQGYYIGKPQPVFLNQRAVNFS